MADSQEKDPTTLYRLFDEDNRLLYVGISASRLGARRFGQHSQKKEWWQEIATATLEHYASREVALDKERDAIRSESPIHNIQSNPKRGKEPHPVVFEESKDGDAPIKSDAPIKWFFESLQSGYERDISLCLYPEPNMLACLDDVYFEGIDGDEEIDYYAKYLERKGLLNDEVPIYWFVRSPDEKGFFENAPNSFAPHKLSTDFLERFTTPINGDQEIDWFQLPVIGARFKTFWDALGYLPSPFQPHFPMRSLIKSRHG